MCSFLFTEITCIVDRAKIMFLATAYVLGSALSALPTVFLKTVSNVSLIFSLGKVYWFTKERSLCVNSDRAGFRSSCNDTVSTSSFSFYLCFSFIPQKISSTIRKMDAYSHRCIFSWWLLVNI